MSKPVKELLRKEISRRLQGRKELAVVSVVGINGIKTNRLRGDLQRKGIEVLVVKNAMARQAFTDMDMGAAAALLEGPCALAYGGESVVDLVREVLGRVKDLPTLRVKGAYMEGEVYGPDRVVALSKFPTRIEALGALSLIATTPGSKLVGAILSPGGILAGILKTIEEKQKDAEEPKDAEELQAAAEPQAPPAM